jgi:hypothetical protein
VIGLESKFKRSEIHLVSPGSHYNESDTRSEYIDPLLDALGWDSRNRLGVYFANREVIREESQERDDSAAKKPDYTLRVNGISKLYVEAKRPAVNILTNMEAISQARRYGYTAGHPIVVLTNYRDLCIYDATIPIQADDRPEVCRIYRWHYDEIAIKWAQVYRVIGRSSAGDADWEEQFSSRHGPVQPVPADTAFVEQLNRWRVEIGQDIVERDPLITEPVLNDVVQRLLNRLIFVRMCEDRGIEGKDVLRKAFAGTTADIKALFKRLDTRYNTGLFANSDSSNDPSLVVDAALLRRIVENLYSPRSTLSFAVLNADFLGLVYEATLAKHLTVTVSGKCRKVGLNTKPEYDKRDIITTPQRLVNASVKATFRHLDPAVVRPSVLDFATGSGRFLLSAFDRIVERYTASLIEANSLEDLRCVAAEEWRLTFDAKKRLLTSSVYGIDIDYNAVEVARFGLLVRLLDDESALTLPPRGKKILPDLVDNIIHGNTLVRVLPVTAKPKEVEQTQPLDLSMTKLPSEFDVIIGNPPYMKTEDMKRYDKSEFSYLKAQYTLLHKQFDKYMAFVEFAVDHLKPEGCLGMVIPNKWMTVVAGEKLRERLRNEVRVAELANFRHIQVFSAKSIYVCSLIAKRSSLSGFDYCEPDSIADFAEARNPTYRIDPHLMPPIRTGAWVLPGNAHENQVLTAIRSSSVQLDDVVTARNGIQTSANAVYVLKDPAVHGQAVTFEKDGAIWSVEEAMTRPYLDGSQGVASYHEVQADARVIFPYRAVVAGTNRSGWELVPESDMKKDYPLTYGYLVAHKGAISTRDMGGWSAGAFYAYGRHQGLSYCTQAPKIFYSVNQTGHKYGIDLTGIVYASGGTAGEVALYPKDLNVSLDFVLALLDQTPIEFFVRKRGSAFRGGYFARGTDVIGEIPVPKLDFSIVSDKQFHDDVAKAMQDLRKLHMRTSSVPSRSRTQHDAKIMAIKTKMDSYFQQRWGLTQADYDRLRMT